MRAALSIALLAVLGLPFFTPLLAMGALSDATLPACCRMHGKHHCAMSVAARLALEDQGAHFNGPVERCPYWPTAVVSAQANLVSVAASGVELPNPATHPNGIAQSESKWRMARERARQKRGPPSA